MSAAQPDVTDPASVPDPDHHDEEARVAHKTRFNEALSKLYETSKSGGGRILSIADVARIRGVLQGYDNLSTKERHRQDAYNIQKRYILGTTGFSGTYRTQDVLQKGGKVICPWEDSFEAITLVHDNRKSTLHSPTPFYGAAQLTPF
jgi:hypothetical protein